MTIGTGEGMADEGMGATKRTIANRITLYSEYTHKALPRPPFGTVCGVDVGNGDLAYEVVEATGRKINRNSLCICERSLHLINHVMS